MEERHTQIREGAGLEESKLNVEFIEWLRRWSSPILVVTAAIVLAFVLYGRWQASRQQRVDQAFRELELARTAGNPQALLVVAETFEAQGAVGLLARLAAADAYLRAARMGLRPGVPVPASGPVPPDDLLSQAERDDILAQAATLYEDVLRRSESQPGRVLHALGAAYGLAAVAECRGDLNGARSAYERAARLAERAGFAHEAALARRRLEQLDGLDDPPRLYSRADLPAVADTTPASGVVPAAPGPSPEPQFQLPGATPDAPAPDDSPLPPSGGEPSSPRAGGDPASLPGGPAAGPP